MFLNILEPLSVMEQYAKMSDEELLDRYAQGEHLAFEVFFHRHRGRVYHYISKKVNQPELAAELSQDVFLKLHSKIHLYKSNSPALSWLFTIVFNTCVDSWRKNGKNFPRTLPLHEDSLSINQSEMISTDQNWQNIKDSVSENENLNCAVKNLSAEQRTVLEGRILEDKSFTLLSQQLGKTEVALRKIYSRAIQKLRSALERRDEGDGK